MELFERNLDRYRDARLSMAQRLEEFAGRLAPESSDGALSLPEVTGHLRSAAAILRSGTFRLMLMGDMKRGKSTLLNAMLGEEILPARVTPSTAIITLIRYGGEPGVTVHYRDREPEQIGIPEYRERFTIPPEEARAFEESGRHTFPDVDYAVLTYPLGLLEKNVEFVDSPGLNDTEERNRITFDYLPYCHAVLFVMSAMQPFTRTELEYLEEHLAGRGYTVFFLLNFWNQLPDSVLHPEDLAAQEERLRRQLRANLARYCRRGEEDLYERRVFEIDALGALRGRIEGKPLAALPETGVPGFLAALDEFLLADRGQAELRKAAGVGTAALERVEEAAARRIELLRQPVQDLRRRVDEVEPQFRRLQEIRDRIEERIRSEGERQAEAVAIDFESFLTDLHQTFEAEFPTFAPAVRIQHLFTLERRQEFEQAVNDAFRRYMASKVDDWRARNDERLRIALAALEGDIGGYGRDYQAIVGEINRVVGGMEAEGQVGVDPDHLPPWTRYASAAAGLFSGEVSATGVGDMEWKELALNLGTVIGFNLLMARLLGSVGGPIAMVVTAVLVGSAQIRSSMAKLTSDMRTRLQEQLPEFARQNREAIRSAVAEAFDRFRERVGAAVQGDIADLRHELDTLLRQVESEEFSARAAEQRITALLAGGPEQQGIRALVHELQGLASGFDARSAGAGPAAGAEAGLAT